MGRGSSGCTTGHRPPSFRSSVPFRPLSEQSLVRFLFLCLRPRESLCRKRTSGGQQRTLKCDALFVTVLKALLQSLSATPALRRFGEQASCLVVGHHWIKMVDFVPAQWLLLRVRALLCCRSGCSILLERNRCEAGFRGSCSVV